MSRVISRRNISIRVSIFKGSGISTVASSLLIVPFRFSMDRHKALSSSLPWESIT